jgi:hypothetical protein
MSGKAVKSAIDALDGSVTGSGGASKTVTALSQTNGVVSATYGDISITKSQVSDFPTLGTAAAKNVPDSGNAGSSEVVMGNDTRLTDARTANGGTADAVAHKLTISNSTVSMGQYDGSVNGLLQFNSYLATINASNWSSTVDSDGYYTNQVALAPYFNTYYQPKVSLCGSNRNTLPTSAEIATYNLCDVFYMDDGAKKDILIVRAKTKPTTTFYVMIKGVYANFA